MKTYTMIPTCSHTKRGQGETSMATHPAKRRHSLSYVRDKQVAGQPLSSGCGSRRDSKSAAEAQRFAETPRLSTKTASEANGETGSQEKGSEVPRCQKTRLHVPRTRAAKRLCRSWTPRNQKTGVLAGTCHRAMDLTGITDLRAPLCFRSGSRSQLKV